MSKINGEKARASIESRRRTAQREKDRAEKGRDRGGHGRASRGEEKEREVSWSSARLRPPQLPSVAAVTSPFVSHRVDRRRHDQRQHQREEQSADDADGERLEELGAGAEGQGERQHAEHGGEGRHQHGAEAAAAGAAEGGGEVFAGAEVVFDGVEHEDAVFRDDADDHDQAHHRDDVERRARDEQRGQAAGEREHGAGDDRGGMRKRAELDHEHEEDQRDGRPRATRSSRNDACCS